MKFDLTGWQVEVAKRAGAKQTKGLGRQKLEKT